MTDEISGSFEYPVNHTVDRFLGVTFEIQTAEVIIHSSTAVTRVLHQINMGSYRIAFNPLQTGTVIDKTFQTVTAEEWYEMKKVPYRALIGSLLYLCKTMRPDLAYFFGLLSCYISNLVNSHWFAGSHVLPYPAVTVRSVIWFQNNYLKK